MGGVIISFAATAIYVVWHLWRITPGGWALKLLITGLFVLWMALAFAGFGMLEKVPVRTATVLYEAGNPWLVAFLYLLIAFIAADILRLCHVLPAYFLHSSSAGLLSITGLVAFVMISGNIHYRHKYREVLTITTGKPLDGPLTVVLASDLHLGYHNRRSELARWIKLFKAENPDLVLIAGDLLDGSARPAFEGNYAAEFQMLDAPVFAVMGNHEYYGGLEGSGRFFDDADIKLLRDSTAWFRGVCIVGRDDRTNPSRESLSDILDKESHSAFTILLDHQPYHLEEAEAAGIDFQFSGHTHRGQVWPLSWVTDAIYEKSWGRHQRGSTRYYVSSGLGIWGPKIRIGTRSEYLVLHIVPE